MSIELASSLIVILPIVGWIIFRIIQEQGLKGYLLKNGVEVDAKVQYLGASGLAWIIGGMDGNASLLFKIEVSFTVKDQLISKRMTTENWMWSPKLPSIGDVKTLPVLVDPNNPQRFLFNMRKFNLKKPSDDSIKNFLERNKAENPNQNMEDS